jgi:transglutaminase-like putative cysteine protease
MNRCHLVHVTEFQYDGPVSESYNEVRLRPLHDDLQSCLSFRLATVPQARSTSYQDYFGNWVHQFNVLGEHRHLRIEAESVVLLHAPPPLLSGGLALAELDALHSQLLEDHYDFLATSKYVPHLSRVTELVRSAEAASGGVACGFVQAASDLVHEQFRYEKGATHVHSSIEDALSSGAGVCQDFAHLLLAMVRLRGLPGRYVSGYLTPGDVDGNGAPVLDVIGGQASHAWMEVFLPGSGWAAFDPTLGAPVSWRHVRVAYGRDYGDVAPVRGVYKGHAGQRLSVDVRLRPVVDGDGHEQWQETAAGPPVPTTDSLDVPQQQPQQQQQQ